MQADRTHDRREFLRRTATVAWATPLLLTLSASSADAQVSCAPTGTPCGVWNGTNCTGISVICCDECNPTSLDVGSPCECT